ncbi:MAG: ArnT family glycosyltransferase [Anaerolineae bacterium]
MFTITPIKRRDVILLMLIVFIAGVMRFGNPSVVEFFHDDAMLATLAQEMVAGERIPLTGINSSVGIPNPPTSVYVMAIPFLFDSNPMTAIYFIMALNVIGVGLLWLITHRYFGRTAGLVAGLAYALSPWAILYSRKIWAQDFHTPFILLGILLGLYSFCEAKQRQAIATRPRWLSRHEWAQAWTLPILLFGFQIHFASWALLPLYAVLLMMAWKRISWRALTVSAGLSLLVMTPYLIGFYQTGMANPDQANLEAVGMLANNESAFSGLSLRYLSFLATGYGLETWLAPSMPDVMNQAVNPSGIWLLIGGMVLLGTGLLARKRWRTIAPLIIVWAYLPALSLIPQWAGVYPHYFIASIPALMLLAGVGVAEITELVPLESLGRTIVLVAFAFVLLTQGLYFRGAMRFVDRVDLQYPAFTIPIHYLHDVERELAGYDDVLVLSDGMAWDLHHESVVWSVMLADDAQCVRTLVGDGYAVFPESEFAVLQAPNMPENAIDGLYLTDDPITVPEREGSTGYAIHHWDEAPVWEGTPITTIDPFWFEGDVLLTGYGISDGVIVLEWQLPDGERGLDYQWSVQPHDSDGNKLGQSDTVFWHGRHWCARDRLLTWQWYELPADTQRLHVALYQLGDAQGPAYINANILDPQGNPISNHASFAIER